jgi:dipeptidyl-peptidase-3
LDSSGSKNEADPRERLSDNRPRLVGELERLGPGGREVLVLGVDAPGFENLPADRKVFAYYLCRAAIAGNDILYTQNHRHGLEVRRLAEEVFIHSRDVPGEIRDALHEYLKLVWIHHGYYNHYSHTKFVPFSLTREGFRAAVQTATSHGASAVVPGEALHRTLARLERTIFDPEFEPIQTNQSDGADIVATSAVNFWDPGITQRELDSLPEAWRHRLNVRYSRKNGGIAPEVYRIGGLFGEDLATVSHFLGLALPLSEDEPQRRSIERLLDFYSTGEEELFREHSIHWLKSNPAIDYVNGFIEQYIDPRGVIGSFEANVNYRAGDVVAGRIAENALYFEERMPWPERFKRPAPETPVARVVDVIVETGDAGPISPAAYNLPNYNDIRRDHGSKNVILLNIENTQSQSLLEKTAKEFYLPEYRDKVLRFFIAKARPLQIYMHEIIGHGSGQPDPDLAVDPRTVLGRVYAALEECRADLAALYHMSDPKLVEIGAVTADEQQAVVETAYVTQLQGWLMRYDQVVGMEIREAHNRGDQLILMYLIQNGGDDRKDFGVAVVEHGGKIYVRLRDVSKMREGVRELLCRLQTMKSTGDYAGAAALFDRFGTRVNPAWHKNIVARLEALKVPKVKAFVFPRLEPVLFGERIVDVRIHHDEDLTAQQLRFNRLQRVKTVGPGV